jgi:hypothetical protein
MPTSDTFNRAMLDLIFNNAGFMAPGGQFGLQGTDAPGALYVALHTASVGEDGNQSTNEVSYPGYARIAVERSKRGWVRTGDCVCPADHITFAAVGGGAEVLATHFSVGTAAEGPGVVLFRGKIMPQIRVENATRPRLTSATSISFG